MSVVAKYPNDVFVSYAHANNQKLGKQDRGWVTDFRDALEIILKQRSPSIKCWKDDQLRAGEEVTDSLRHVIADTGVFIPVISEAYLKSTFCRLELDEFCSLNHKGKGRIVPVVIDGTPVEELPQLLREPRSTRFTRRDEAAGLEFPLARPLRYDESLPYWVSAFGVAEGVWKILNELQRSTGDPLTPIAVMHEDYRSALPVYLAEVTDDLVDQRALLLDTLERGSRAKGLQVEPKEQLNNSADVVSTCRAALARSKLSIHLIGALRGRPWGNSGKPVVHMQVEEALARDLGLRPIVWMAPELQVGVLADKDQQHFLNSLQGRVELIQINFEKFLSLVGDRLFPRPAPVWRSQESFLVYVAHCHRTDDAEEVRNLLQQLRFATTQLDHCPTGPEVLQRHHVNLKNCDGLVILYDGSSLPWAEELAQQAWGQAQQLQRPRMTAAVATPPLKGQEFGFQHEHLVTIELAAGNGLKRLDEFLSGMRRNGHV
jgi:hypothetical protein